MKILSTISFIICAAVLIGVAQFDHQQLPPKIASHFNGSGVANGWMASSSFTFLMVVIGLGLPAFVIGVLYSTRFFPSSLLNVPNAEYWRTPQNYRMACDYLFYSSLWFGCAFVLWQAALFHMIVAANLVTPPHLNSTEIILLASLLLIFTGAWITTLLRHFLKTNTVEQGAAANP